VIISKEQLANFEGMLLL